MCLTPQTDIPTDVLRYHRRDELPTFGSVIRWAYQHTTYEGEVIGFERRYGQTRVIVVQHLTTCDQGASRIRIVPDFDGAVHGCIETRLRTYEGTVVA